MIQSGFYELHEKTNTHKYPRYPILIRSLIILTQNQLAINDTMHTILKTSEEILRKNKTIHKTSISHILY